MTLAIRAELQNQNKSKHIDSVGIRLCPTHNVIDVINVFLSMHLTTLLGTKIFLLTKILIWLGGGLAIGAVLQNYFEKKKDSEPVV